MFSRISSSSFVANREWVGLGLAGSLLMLAGCDAGPVTRHERVRPAQDAQSDTPATSSTRPANKAAPVPAFLVNELREGLIPSAPQVGELVARDGCLVFVMRGSAATPLWPFGSTLNVTAGGLRVTVPGREPISVPSTTSLPGAFVPLNSTNMTRFDGTLPVGCPAAIFAVAKP